MPVFISGRMLLVIRCSIRWPRFISTSANSWNLFQGAFKCNVVTENRTVELFIISSLQLRAILLIALSAWAYLCIEILHLIERSFGDRIDQQLSYPFRKKILKIEGIMECQMK